MFGSKSKECAHEFDNDLGKSQVTIGRLCKNTKEVQVLQKSTRQTIGGLSALRGMLNCTIFV